MENSQIMDENSNSPYHLNLLPFQASISEVKVQLGRQESDRWCKVHYTELPKYSIEKLGSIGDDDPWVYVNFEPERYKADTLIQLEDHPRLALKYYDFLLMKHLLQTDVIVDRSFVHTPVVWIKKAREQAYTVFGRFELKVVFPFGSKQPAIRIAYLGQTMLLNGSMQRIDEKEPEAAAEVSRVFFERRIYPFKRLPDEALGRREAQYPILNRKLAKLLRIAWPDTRIGKKHRDHLDMLQEIKEKLCENTAFTDVFKPEQQFYSVARFGKLAAVDSVFVFGQGQKHRDIYRALQQYGPYKPLKEKQLAVFFICHADDAGLKQQLSQLILGNDRQAGMGQYLKIAVMHETRLDIVLNREESEAVTVKTAISRMELRSDIGYLAIYISPYGKFDSDVQKHRIYYQVKEILLQRSIVSQTIDAQKARASSTALRYWIPNITIATIAKLGGIPWVLDTGDEPELVVGFGLYSSVKYQLRSVGASFCFSPKGVFRGFDYFADNETYSISALLEEALRRYVAQVGKPKRLIIHYYKTISKREFEPVRRMIHSFGADIPVFVVEIKSNAVVHSFVGDTGNATGLPADGSVFRVGKLSYLLYINGFDGQGDPKHQPMPMHCQLKASDNALLEDHALVMELLGQVYHFSKLHWRSIKQSPLAVTVDYPRLLVSHTTWFDGHSLPEKVKGMPWFL